MDAVTLRAADPAKLRWMEPAGSSPEAWSEVRPRLEKLVVAEHHDPVYEAKRRAIFLASDDVLGAVGIKEIRTETRSRELLFRLAREHPGLREFRGATAFLARGGHTPRLFGAAVEEGPLGPARVLLFVEWIAAARTLDEYLAREGSETTRPLVRLVARRLAEDARLGFVHGRHSSHNLLVLPASESAGESVDVQPIDFAYSRMVDGFDRDGFAGDVSRVCIYLAILDRWPRPWLRELAELSAQAAETGPAAAQLTDHIIEKANRYLQKHFGYTL